MCRPDDFIVDVETSPCQTCGRGGPEFFAAEPDPQPVGYHGPKCPDCDLDDPIWQEDRWDASMEFPPDPDDAWKVM